MLQAEASLEKDRGNAAFGEKRYAEAVKHFSRCIELDPANEVYFSNRSAAYASIEKYEAALQVRSALSGAAAECCSMT